MLSVALHLSKKNSFGVFAYIRPPTPVYKEVIDDDTGLTGAKLAAGMVD